MAKGCLDMDDENCLFTVGQQAKDFSVYLLEESDLVFCIGYDLVEYHPSLWNKKGSKKIIHIDFTEAEVDEHYSANLEVVGDLAHSLWMLNELLAKDPLKFDQSYVKKVRAEYLKDFAEYKDDDTEGIIKPQKCLWDVRQVLGPDDVLLSDVGAHKMWIARYYQCHEPNTCLISNGFCSMGFALPGAIGAKLALPDRKILAICGDGGFLMNVQEMETAKRIGTNIVVLVWEDGGYGLISWKQDNQFGKHTQLSFSNPDFLKLAEAFGWHGFRVNNSRDLKATLIKAFECDGPALISIPIDYRENPLLTKKFGEIHKTFKL
jgi:acetolactate synthase-1/2/3 large subunit